MDEYLCLTIRSARGETEKEFKSRIIAFWSEVCKGKPDTFERVYAETSAFEQDGHCLTRKYLVESAAAAEVYTLMEAGGLKPDPADEVEVYTKYEATPPEWFQIEH